MKILVIDNYDSFTWNLVQLVGMTASPDDEVVVFRHDERSVHEIKAMLPDAIIISPGPGGPHDAGISNDCILSLPSVPILGVCLGLQVIASCFGGNVVRSPTPTHGKTSLVYHNNEDLFSGLPNPLSVARYHSLIVDQDSLPPCFAVLAWLEDGTIMGVRHRERPLWGVQFHPESFMTEGGDKIVSAFLKEARC